VAAWRVVAVARASAAGVVADHPAVAVVLRMTLVLHRLTILMMTFLFDRGAVPVGDGA